MLLSHLVFKQQRILFWIYLGAISNKFHRLTAVVHSGAHANFVSRDELAELIAAARRAILNHGNVNAEACGTILHAQALDGETTGSPLGFDILGRHLEYAMPKRLFAHYGETIPFPSTIRMYRFDSMALSFSMCVLGAGQCISNSSKRVARPIPKTSRRSCDER